MQKFTRLAHLERGFTPARPVNKFDLFAGRDEQIGRCVGAYVQEGLHIVVYGERGVGKTSLANVLPEIIRGAKLPFLDAVRVDCSSESAYEGLWIQACTELKHPWPGGEPVNPEAIRFHLQSLEKSALIVFDELDRFKGRAFDAFAPFADTIKTLSDHNVQVTLMLVGVADSVEHLIGHHESIARNLSQIEMPRMRPHEAGSILDKGFAIPQMHATDEVRAEIVRLSEGLPHFVHFLALEAGRVAAEDDRDEVIISDLSRGIARAVSGHNVMSQYRKATDSPQPGHLYEKVVLACALAPKDQFGEFRAADICKPLATVMRRDKVGITTFARHLKELSTPARGEVLMKLGTSHNHRYRFRDPFLQPFAKLVALKTGLTTTDVLDTYERGQSEGEDMGSWWTHRHDGSEPPTSRPE